MEKELAYLNIKNGEEKILILPTDGILWKSIYDCCLVGCLLTKCVVHFLAMKNTMANLWLPLGGESMAKLFGDFIGEFIDYDMK
ncbi:hypothetical protein Gohar_000955, partial [Gossypium harknessii]|nr:hypothetical protein [Gossypium harknessii]